MRHDPRSIDLVIRNARVVTLDPRLPEAKAVAIAGGRFVAVGDDGDAMKLAEPATQVIDAGGRRMIPGLIDSHSHVIRGGLNYNMELRWDGIPTLAEAMQRLKEQARRTPPPQWVRVVGGFTELQFAERRLPTLEEINEAAPETPVFILHLYDRALLNRAALRATGYTRETPDPPGGSIVRDRSGEPTGLLLAKPNALLLYSALAKGPRLPFDQQVNSTRHFMRELNRLGVTSVIDAGGGFQNYPDDYKVIEELHANGQLTLRLAYNLFTQKPKEELADFTRWSGLVQPLAGDDFYRHNGAGEMLAFAAADFEDFREPRPDMPPDMERDLEGVVRLLAQRRWPFRMHATYDETITRALDVFEKVDTEVPLAGLHWFFDHAETVSDANLERIARLGGGIAIQHRMAYQGEFFIARHGLASAARTPPYKRMLEMGLRVGAGTDATRVASYDPWNVLYWLTTGRTLGGTAMYPTANLVDRETALRMMTESNAWFSNDQEGKGTIRPGQLADFALLSADYMSVPDEAVRQIVSHLTVVGGRVVYADDDFRNLDPGVPPPAPDWSPARRYGGYFKGSGHRTGEAAVYRSACACGTNCSVHRQAHAHAAATPSADAAGFWGALGCACWA